MFIHRVILITLLLSSGGMLVLVGCVQSDPGQGVVDLDGRPVNPLKQQATVMLFLRSDCPISNRYAPEIIRLHKAFANRGVRFYLVYVDPDEAADTIRTHVQQYGLPGYPLRDTQHALVNATKASKTPEAAVFDASGTKIYLGRIDDRFVDFGKARPKPTQQDLQEVLEAILDGTITEPRTTEAVGCYIKDLKPMLPTD